MMSFMKRSTIEPKWVRRLPFLSKRRRESLKNFYATMNRDMNTFHNWCSSAMPVPERHMYASSRVPELSSHTLDMIADTFKEINHDGIVDFLSIGKDAPDGEMLLRAICSYRHVLLSHIGDNIILGTGQFMRTHEPERRDARCSLERMFTAARSKHANFMLEEDPSALTGNDRARFEALLIVLSGCSDNMAFDSFSEMTHALSRLVMDRPDRADDIVKYQKERGIHMRDMDAAAVAEYLDCPSTVLSVGAL